MKKIRGVSNLVKYLHDINVPMGVTTIYGLVRSHRIPFSRPTPGIILFDTDKIDAWINGEEASAK